MITDEISQDFEHALDVAAKFGIKAIDVRKAWNKNIALFTNEELNKMKEVLAKHAMKLTVVTGPTGKCLLPSSKFSNEKDSLIRNPNYNLSLFDRIIEIADFFGTNLIRIFTFMKMGMKSKELAWKEAITLLNPLIKKAEDSKKILLVENDLGMNVGKISQINRFFEDITSPAVKIILDPGNFFMEREPTSPEAYECLYEKNLVGHIHVKDPKRKIPKLGAIFGVVGEGKVNYRSLFKQAIDHGYKGFFSLETHSLRKKEQVSLKSLENMASWLKDL